MQALAQSADGYRMVPLIGITLAASLGGLLTLAFPPFQLVPMAFVALSGLLWLLWQERSTRSAALLGWVFGLGHFTTSLYWIGFSFYVDAEQFGTLAVPSILGLSAFLAAFPALACAGAHWLAGGRGPALWLAFTALWSAAEWVRGHVLSGFPWNLTGYVWTAAEAPLQVASAIGIYGLGFLTVAVACLPALALGRGASGKMRWAPLGAAGLAVVVLWLAGDARLHLASGQGYVEGVRLRLVQPNVPQRLKWRPDQRQAILDRLLGLTKRAAVDQPTHVLWPETAVPGRLLGDSTLRRRIAAALPSRAVLVTGTVRSEEGAGSRPRVFNSIAAIDSAGNTVGVYDKVRLVPFGEYVPLSDILPFVKMTAGPIDFAPGEEASTLTVPGAPAFQPLICYESIFPGNRPGSGDAPEWLLNLTNDAWFGESSGPYQHFEMSRVRAIERGLPLVRVANTGISAVIDPYGRVLAQLPLAAEGAMDARLPQKIEGETLFAQVGNVPFFAMIGLSFLSALLGRLWYWRCARTAGRTSMPAAAVTQTRKGKR